MKVPIELVKELRQKTAAGVLDCQKALAASNNDLSQAFVWLLEKSRTRFEQKRSRCTPQGLVGVAVDEEARRGVVVEINTETDFVPRVPGFQQLLRNMTQATLKEVGTTSPYKEHLGEQELPVEWLQQFQLPGIINSTPLSVADSFLFVFGQVGENMNLRKGTQLHVGENALVASFNQGLGLKGMGTVATLVALEWPSSAGSVDRKAMSDFGFQLAKHVAGYAPKYLHRDQVPKSVIDERRKRPHFNEKTFIKDIALMEQDTMRDGVSVPLKQVIDEQKQKLGVSELVIKQFVRWEAGEGIEREDFNFAEEVEKELKKREKKN